MLFAHVSQTLAAVGTRFTGMKSKSDHARPARFRRSIHTAIDEATRRAAGGGPSGRRFRRQLSEPARLTRRNGAISIRAELVGAPQ
jgi:hypothetical protein